MAKRRRVGNLLALAALSALVERPMHPYEMAAVLRSRAKDRDMKIKWGSLYTVVANMERHGLIDAVSKNREGGRPERTVYRITDAGRGEFEDWAQELISTPEREQPRFEAGLSMLGALHPREAQRLLEQRLNLLSEQLGSQRATLAESRVQVARLFLVEAEYDLAMREAESAWVAGLLVEMKSGEFPGIGQWASEHEAAGKGGSPASPAARKEQQ